MKILDGNCMKCRIVRGFRSWILVDGSLMEDLIPLLHKLAQGREISGLGAYEQ
jgi:type I restriction enzyme, R subunit